MDPVVRTEAGYLRGATSGPASVFLGVPYAEAPVGSRRFGPPARRSPWDGVRDAFHYGPTAPQPGRAVTIIPEPVLAGDDCLNLNVFTPDVGGGGLPVLVWIHGGGFVAGSSASSWYRGESFARSGVVTVSLNYRLGAEGFLRIDGAPSNRGALDWIAALEWVQANIGAFGGDAGNVTVAGQSAGGAAAAVLLAVPRARGLFRRVIAMSGTPSFTGTADDARRVAELVAARLGLPPALDAMAGVAPEALVAAQDAVQAGAFRSGTALALPFTPYVDGELLPAAPMAAIAGGAGGDAELLVGCTAHEFNAAVRRSDRDWSRGDVRRRLERLGVRPEAVEGYTSRHAGQLGAGQGLAGEPLAGEPLADVVAQAVTDATFRVPALRLAGARQGSIAATFAYEFRWHSPVPGLRAVHCLDVPFAFDVLGAEGVATVAGPEPPQALADEMHRAWVAFLEKRAPGWAPYDRRRRTMKLFDTPSDVADDPLVDERTAWGLA